MKNQSQEDYLRTMYLVFEKTGSKENIKSVDIAKHLNVSKAAVSKMLKKLQEQEFILVNPYSTITLTPKGFQVAKKLIFKYRVIAYFLVKVLKVTEEKAHIEAHELEHAFSYETVQKLFEYLDNPQHCFCGRKIPKI